MVESLVFPGMIFGSIITVFLIFFLEKEIKSKRSWKSSKKDIITSQQIKKSNASFFSKMISVFFDSEASLILNSFRLKYKKIYIVLYVIFSLFFIVFLGISQLFPKLFFTHSYRFHVIYSFSLGSFIGQIVAFLLYSFGSGDSSGFDGGTSSDSGGGGFDGGGGDSGGGGAGD